MSLPSPGRWNVPFNDSYINIRRQEVRSRIPVSEIVQRIAAIAKIAILGSGRRAAMRKANPYTSSTPIPGPLQAKLTRSGP